MCNSLQSTMSLSWVPIESPYAEIVDRWFNCKHSLYTFNPGKCVMPIYFSEYAQQILDAEVRKDDVWVVSFPRAGSTWCQEMVWLIGNDLDFNGASTTIQQLRAPMIEMSVYFRDHKEFSNLIEGNSVDYVRNKQSPRYIKSHLPLGLLPKQLNEVKPKIIYIARNPKDLSVSYYYHIKQMHNMNSSYEEMARLFCKGKVPIGCLWNHYLPFWEKRNEANILFLKYEDMLRDTKTTIHKIATFMEKDLKEEQVEELHDFLKIEKMRHNPGMNMTTFVDTCKKMGVNYDVNFIRKGKTGDWKNYMTSDLVEIYDEWIDENTKETGLHFD